MAGFAATDVGDLLQAYTDALHRTREPFGTSAYDAMVALAAAPAEARTSARIPIAALRRLDAGALVTIRSGLGEYTELGAGRRRQRVAVARVDRADEEDARTLATTVAEFASEDCLRCVTWPPGLRSRSGSPGRRPPPSASPPSTC